MALTHPYFEEDDKRIAILMDNLQKLRQTEEKITKELRQLIYKIEKPR